jgi:endoglucanase
MRFHSPKTSYKRISWVLKLLFLVAGTATSASQGAALHAATANTTSSFHRGVAIHDAMNWATVEPGKDRRYRFPPFSDASHPLTLTELAIIRRAGFDFVRLTVDPGPFLQFEGVQRAATYDILRARVRMILDAGLSVIVDFHPVTQNSEYGPRALIEGADTPIFAAYCDMLKQTALVLDDMHSDRVALEVMNEPQLGGTASSNMLWQEMEERAYRSVRSASERLKIVLAGAASAEYEGLLALDPTPFANDANAIFTFHYYLPYIFTNQSLPTNANLRLAADIPYPARAGSIADGIAALRRRLENSNETGTQKLADAKLGIVNLSRYYASNFNRADIQGHFDRVGAWAQAHNIPASRILLGEFGVIRRYETYEGALDRERLLWLKDVRQEAEAHGYSWAIWAYRGHGGMAIVTNDNEEAIDHATLQSLGLK